MPQRDKVTWAQLRVGALVIVSLVILALGIFFISGQVGFLTRRYTLKTYFSSAGGLREGAQVRLAGVPAGNVERIRISSSSDPARAVEVTLRVARDYQDQIREGSVATIETAGLLGEGYIDISRGGVGQKLLPDGSELKSREEADIKQIVQNTNDVISNLRVLSSKLNDITTQIQSGKGSMGRFIYDPSLYNRMNDTTSALQHLLTRVEQGQGTLGKLATDETLYQKAVASVDRLNQIMDEVQHGKGSMAKFISDPSVYDNIKELVARGNKLMDNINSGQGTLGKLANDPQLYNRMNDTFGHMNVIAARMDQGEGTLGKLSTDATLFNNLRDSSASLKDFLTEFRKNPKKYLTLRLRIF